MSNIAESLADCQRTMSTEPNTDAAVAWLWAWPTERLHLWAKQTDPHTGAEGGSSGKTFERTDAGRAAMHTWIAARQGKSNIYFHVNDVTLAVTLGVTQRENDEKKIVTVQHASESDISLVVALHIDCDLRPNEDLTKGIERIVKRFKACTLPPSIISITGGGAQAFWLLSEPYVIGDPSEARQRIIQLERDLGDCDATHDLSRVMRVPFTWNVPKKAKRNKGRKMCVATVESSDGPRYRLQDFKAAPLPKNAADQEGDEPAATTTVADALAKVTDDMRSMIITGEPNDSGRDLKVACALVGAGCSDRVIQEIFKTYPNDEQGHPARVKRLIARARQWCAEHADSKLAEMNDKFCVLPVGGKTRILTWRPSSQFKGREERMYSTADDFRALHDKYRHMVAVPNKNGGFGMESVPMGTWWWNNKNRQQYDGGMRFMPQHDESVVGDVLNLWTGFSVLPVAGRWDKFIAHILFNICNDNMDHFQYLMRWMATIVQARKRTGVCVMLRSDEEGAGKGFFAKHFGFLFGPHYMQVNDAGQVFGQHNDHLEALLLINEDEAFFAGDPRHRNKLYNLITEKTIPIEPKFVGTYTAPNFLNHVITTNSEHAIPVGPTARRFFALNVAPHVIGRPEYFDRIEDQLLDGGYEAMLQSLMDMDLSNFDVRRVPKTEALAEQAMHSRKGIDAVIEQIAHTAWLPDRHRTHLNIASTKGDTRGDGFWSWVRNNFPDLSRAGATGLGHAFEKWGCDKWSSGGPHIRFPKDIGTLRDMFDAKHGKQDWSRDPAKWGADGPGPKDAPVQEEAPF